MKVIVRRKHWWDCPRFLDALDLWDDYNERKQIMEDNGYCKPNCRGMEPFLEKHGFGYIPRTTFYGYGRLDGNRQAIDRSKQFNFIKKRKKRMPDIIDCDGCSGG